GGVTQTRGRQHTAPTQGKVAWFQKPLKKWLTARPPLPATLAQLQALLDTFIACYNQQRPHKSLPGRATPATGYAARPKAAPGDRGTDTHNRVRTDIIGETGTVTLRHAGKLYHIGIGRTHARTHILPT